MVLVGVSASTSASLQITDAKLSLSFLQAYDETTNFSWDAALHILTKLKVEISVCLEVS